MLNSFDGLKQCLSGLLTAVFFVQVTVILNMSCYSQCTIFHRKSEVRDLGVGDMAKISYQDF